jgi:hypothetical protein
MAFDALGRYEPILWGLVGVSAVAAAAVLPVQAETLVPAVDQTSGATYN